MRQMTQTKSLDDSQQLSRSKQSTLSMSMVELCLEQQTGICQASRSISCSGFDQLKSMALHCREPLSNKITAYNYQMTHAKESEPEVRETDFM